ncbi:aminopeptidase [bacterium]|nr:aminopeptidase [bacterium]
MFDLNEYYSAQNRKFEGAYQASLAMIENIVEEIERSKRKSTVSPIDQYCLETARTVLRLCGLERELDRRTWSELSIEELQRENRSLFQELVPDHYETSFANPARAVAVFGERIGPYLSFFYAIFQDYPDWIFSHQRYHLADYNQLFIDFWKNRDGLMSEPDSLRTLVTRLNRSRTYQEVQQGLVRQYDPEYKRYTDFLTHTDLTDVRYLFRYGHYINEVELKTAVLLAEYPVEKIRHLARYTVNAFISGFEHHGKTLVPGSTIRLSYWLGQERVVESLIRELEQRGLKPHICLALSTAINPQYDYDHKDDLALYLDREVVERQIGYYEQAYADCIDLIGNYGGDIALNPDKFGEDRITPVMKPENVSFSADQHSLLHDFMNRRAALRLKYIDRGRTSTTCIAFPSPSIGYNFEQIFADIWEVNLVDSDFYERVQQRMIEVMDKGNAIRVTGRNGNETDLVIALQPLSDPERESNFLNGVADVNIPAGEVFTSPQLKGTAGVLHIDSYFEDGLQYQDLKLTFVDGYISDYSCTNFETISENRAYIEDNLLMPHKTLPMGEFAIGTNTLAYVIARKHGIAHKLSTLISEKMAPHIAIGDTCFAMQENMTVINRFDHKLMVARENEKSAQRHDNFERAYTFKHSDIVIPFESIGAISVLIEGQPSVDIIRSGRFVLPGTEELNRPLES